MSCVPYVWQYCWKEISAVAYIFHLVHCLLRHEITLHVLCRDKFSTSMQQFCHPGNNSYKQEPYSFQAYMHTNGPNQMLNNASLLLRFGASLNRGGTPQSSYRTFSGVGVTSPPPKHTQTPPSRARGGSAVAWPRIQVFGTDVTGATTRAKRFGELFAAVPVLHIAKEALQFRYSTYRQID